MSKKELVKALMERMQKFGYFPSFTNVKVFIQEYEKMAEPGPTRPVVPEYIAEWIGYCKMRKISLAHALYRSDESVDERVFRWVVDSLDNQETFAKAWIFGYEIEEEKRYLVKIKLGSFGELRKHHTRKELEEAGFGEVFNSPLFEVEEVEE
ncbi:DUF1642 domain-containing protein [Streptococcus gordonii]|uniref:DUF1642 domain-containing protein n=1 Tax=Streptococcus gordonii TaxID=1302 RepID=UPI000F675C9A|nr:DUF1642 domain-containing protein [Streptococcus gordonii]RSJ46651.1 hypothetical protein D8815_08495 [Streptococcus gordonii]RSJ49684.1 hypothetical protein D8816_00970 [Streptococcus gordonii]